MSQVYLSPALRRRVSESACYGCGYCLTSQRFIGQLFHLEHLIPLAAGGLSLEENLWLSCPLCNGYKGVQTHAFDPETGALMPLFNPRTQRWPEHFRWSDDGENISGQTAVGRVTVVALRLNNELARQARRLWVTAGWHPPVD